MSTENDDSEKAFRRAIVATCVWGIFVLGLVAVRFNDVLSGELKLNSYGDFFAGVFAPLAFVWFFVSTWLQRIELQLQRKELAETRDVLQSQQEELEKTSKEMLKQTKLQREQLAIAREATAFEEHKLAMYYFALRLHRSNIKFLINAPPTAHDSGMQTVRFFAECPPLLNNDIRDVDESIRAQIKYITPRGVGYTDCDNTQIEDLKSIVDQAELLRSDRRFANNSLIRARLEGISFDQMFDMLKQILDRQLNRDRPSGSR